MFPIFSASSLLSIQPCLPASTVAERKGNVPMCWLKRTFGWSIWITPFTNHFAASQDRTVKQRCPTATAQWQRPGALGSSVLQQKSPSSSLRFAFTWQMTSEVSLTQLPHLHIRSASKEHAVLHVDLALAITRNGSSTAAAERHAVCRVHGTQGNLQTHHTARHY